GSVWQTVDGDDRADEIGLGRREPEREKAAERMADHDRPHELVRTDVVRELAAYGREERRVDRLLTGEAREREAMAFVALLEVRDRAVPHLAGRAEAGDQDHRATGAFDIDAEGFRIGVRGGGEDEGEKQEFCSHAPESPRAKKGDMVQWSGGLSARRTFATGGLRARRST